MDLGSERFQVESLPIAFRAFPDEADDDADMKILRRLSALPTIHRYDSRAYALDLETEMNRPDLR